MVNSSSMRLLTRQDETTEDLLTLRRIDAAGETTEVAAQRAEEVLGPAGWRRPFGSAIVA